METWFRKTEAMLYEHKILCAELNAWIAEQADELMNRSYMPSSHLEPMGGSTGRISRPTETYAILRASFPQLPPLVQEKYVQAQQIQAAIGAMTAVERRIYQMKYMDERPDIDIWLELGLSKTSFYRYRRRLVEKVAEIIGIKRPEKTRWNENGTFLERFWDETAEKV